MDSDGCTADWNNPHVVDTHLKERRKTEQGEKILNNTLQLQY